MYDVSHKKENLSMCMYDVIVKKAKVVRQKHKNMFESAVLIVKRAKTRAAHGARGERGARGSCSQAKRPTLTSTRISYLLENLIYIYIYGYRYRE